MLVLVRGGVNKKRFVRTVSRRRLKIDLEVRSGEAPRGEAKITIFTRVCMFILTCFVR